MATKATSEPTDHYIGSADGIEHHQPSKETLFAPVESREATDEFTVHLTNEIPFAIETLRKPSIVIKL